MKTRRILSSLALALGLTLAVLAGLGGNLPRARAATYPVTNTNPSGPGSLRQAILDASGIDYEALTVARQLHSKPARQCLTVF